MYKRQAKVVFIIDLNNMSVEKKATMQGLDGCIRVMWQ